MALLECEEVVKKFDGLVAVDRVSFYLEEGTVFGLIGPNGAGKTTLIRMMVGIFYPDSGIIRICGQPVSKSRHLFGYLPEERGIYQRHYVRDVLVYFGRLRRLPVSEAKNRAEQLLKILRLDEWKKKRVNQLSKGLQQRLQIAIAFMGRPTLVFLDEPFEGLDAVSRQELSEFLVDEAKNGRTILLSTHIIHQAEALCSEVLMIHKGKNVLNRSIPEIKKQFYDGSYLLELENETLLPDLPEFTEKLRLTEKKWKIRLESTKTIPRILESLDNLEIEVAAFSKAYPSLEEVFIKLAKEES